MPKTKSKANNLSGAKGIRRGFPVVFLCLLSFMTVRNSGVYVYFLGDQRVLVERNNGESAPLEQADDEAPRRGRTRLLTQQQQQQDDDHAPINFSLDSQKFVQTLIDCFTDDTCHVLFYHVGKTGGTSLQTRMFTAFPPVVARSSMKSCCGARLMTMFRNASETYCQAKFSSYQADANEFLDSILPTCRELTTNATSTPRHVVLTSFREPIQRSLSAIHQNCNKNLHLRDNTTLTACRRCSYDADRDYWDSNVHEFNEQYQGLQKVVTTVAGMPNTLVMTIDSVDLSSFYEMIHIRSPEYGFNQTWRSNPEKTSTCNFGFTSEMMRGSRPSQEVYRSLTLNRLFVETTNQ